MSAIDLAAALEAVRLGEATGEHAAVLARALEEREADVHARVRAGYDRTIADTWRAEVERRDAELATVRAENERLRTVVIAQAVADAAWTAAQKSKEGFIGGSQPLLSEWLHATRATEALGRELRGAR